MWQIPAEEINRPGNFSTHARKNLNLLLAVLSNLKDASSLLFLAQHLRNKPDIAKQYLRENERVATYRKVRCLVLLLLLIGNFLCTYILILPQAVKLCVQVLKFQAHGVESMSAVEVCVLCWLEIHVYIYIPSHLL